MSLINDALKRAAQKPASQPSASDLAASLRPAEERQRGFPFLTLLIVLIPVIVVGVWFLVKGLRMGEQPAETVAARAPAQVVEAPPEPAPAPVVVVQPTNPPVAIPLPRPTPEVVFKLQGIYWRPSRPSAVVNGKTVYVGDRVETARVAAIDKEGVTLNVDGRPKVLLLP